MRIHVTVKYIGTRDKKSKLCVFKMLFSIEERTSCVLWYTETESIVTTQRRFVQKFGKKITPPSNKSIKKWHRKLKSIGTVE